MASASWQTLPPCASLPPAVRTSPSGCAAPPLPTTRLRQPDPADIRVAPCIEISKPLAVASSTRKLPGISITDQGRRKASGKCHHMRFGQVIPAERCSAETPMVRERPFVGEALLMIVQVRTILSGSKKERHRGWTAARPRNRRAWARPCSRPRRRVSLTGSSRQTLARAGGAFSLTRRCCPGCFISKAIDDTSTRRL
jgi:hypothetical protein